MLSDHLNKRAAETNSAPGEQHPNPDMFGKGKRKPDDEPIVPHGMIWYATPSDPVPAEEEKFDPAAHYAEAMELMRRAKEPPAEAETGERKTNAVVPWWRVQQPEPEPAKDPVIARRPVLPSQFSNSAIPAATPPEPPPIKAAEVAPEAVTVSTPHRSAATTQRPKLGRRNLGLNWAGNSGVTIWRTVIRISGTAQKRCSDILASADIANRLRRGRAGAAGLSRHILVLSRGFGERARISVAKFTRASSVQAQQFTGHLRHNAAAVEKTAAVYIKKRASHGPRVRIVLSGLPLKIKIFLSRRISEWRMKQIDSSQDARLWTSMTLASITAIMALVIVSLVPHFASKSLPSKLLHTETTVSADSPAPASVVSPPAVVDASQKQSITSIPQARAKSDVGATKLPAAKPSAIAAKPKARRHIDDDYVAPDTTKYFGNASR